MFEWFETLTQGRTLWHCRKLAPTKDVPFRLEIETKYCGSVTNDVRGFLTQADQDKWLARELRRLEKRGFTSGELAKESFLDNITRLHWVEKRGKTLSARGGDLRFSGVYDPNGFVLVLVNGTWLALTSRQSFVLLGVTFSNGSFRYKCSVDSIVAPNRDGLVPVIRRTRSYLKTLSVASSAKLVSVGDLGVRSLFDSAEAPKVEGVVGSAQVFEQLESLGGRILDL